MGSIVCPALMLPHRAEENPTVFASPVEMETRVPTIPQPGLSILKLNLPLV